MDGPLTDAQRFPLLTDAGRANLNRLREHPNAPAYNHRCGDRLDAEGLARVRTFKEELFAAKRGWQQGEVPEWVKTFARRCLADVPLYRQNGGNPEDFFSLPTVGRAELSNNPTVFVPDGLSLDDLIVYYTSGRTGHKLYLPYHPEASSMYLPLMELAMARNGLTFEGGADCVSVLTLCHQQSTFVYVSLSAYLEHAGVGKINLHPSSWTTLESRSAFLDDLNAEVYSGDPIAFSELRNVPLTTRPKALFSAAMVLLPGLKAELETHFGCPVYDLYSLNECGPVGVNDGTGFELLPHDIYVEVLDEDGRPCPPGVRGEVTLTGGRNRFLPLLRYRTGDWASLDYSGPLPRLMGLDGRPPVLFRDATGRLINNIDVTWVLRAFSLPRFTLHQNADSSLLLCVDGRPDKTRLGEALAELFGPLPLTISPLAPGDKVIQYTSDAIF